MFLVSGGMGYYHDHRHADYTDSTEIFDPLVGGWTASRAKLPRPMDGIMAASTLLFGNY